LNVLDQIGKRGAGFKSLKDTWADTTTAHGRLMLTVLGGLAEFERELIRARTGEGRKRAKERGVKFGRPRKRTPHQRQEALHRLAKGQTMADVARHYAVDATTIGRLAASSPFEQSAAGPVGGSGEEWTGVRSAFDHDGRLPRPARHRPTRPSGAGSTPQPMRWSAERQPCRTGAASFMVARARGRGR